MGAGLFTHFTLFFLCFFLSSASSPAEKPPSEVNRKNNDKRVLQSQENQVLFSDTIFSDTKVDTIPTVNPTTPDTTPITTPITTPTTIPTTPTTTPTTVIPTSPPAPITLVPTLTPTTPTTTTAGGSWCIASQTASQTALQVALDYACGYGGADCSALQHGASCYEPNTLRDHASYAFNDYYQKNPVPTSCNFAGTAQVVNSDPSSGNCHYASPRATTPTTLTPPMTTTPANPSPMILTSPTDGTSTTPTLGPPTSVYGEPTESPSSATSISNHLYLVLFTVICSVLGSPLLADHL